jgi:hypothetical protein
MFSDVLSPLMFCSRLRNYANVQFHQRPLAPTPKEPGKVTTHRIVHGCDRLHVSKLGGRRRLCRPKRTTSTGAMLRGGETGRWIGAIKRLCVLACGWADTPARGLVVLVARERATAHRAWRQGRDGHDLHPACTGVCPVRTPVCAPDLVSPP